jgi:chemotaxis protein methyltransferase CheR
LRCFAEEVLPEILNDNNSQNSKRVRIWSAGCSTGEEAYTLAIIMMEMTRGMPITWEIHATDLNTDVLQQVKEGLYGRRSVKDIPEAYLARYFLRKGEQFEIHPEVRRQQYEGGTRLSGVKNPE